ncbi:PAS domain S-box protein [Pullulanibacillus sp. KACC 23026]|uniref:PAS domain-containing sensor histidine kinase n=1 Tax=Pullulanibacillus sp. KACC 23026 TaxID=3028315 RepID=UPI0023AE726B|nr:PAS domain-containing sensor histidine kinase [Pullulanibacillus sp. KACC 23026]WEG10852.1 PAS domain S-box protein [Pullulanibacillus sp. KACC 23026]
MKNEEKDTKMLLISEELENYIYYTHHFDDMISRHFIETGEWVYISPSSERLLGYDQAQLHNRRFYELIHPEDREMTIAFLKQSRKDFDKICYRLRRFEGDYLWVESTFKRRVFEKCEECFMVTRNITEIKLAEENLKESEKKYRALVEYSRDTIGILSPGGDWIYINETGKRLFGVTRQEEIIGRFFPDFVSPGDRDDLINYIVKHQRGEVHRPIDFNDVKIIRQDHMLRYTDIKMIPNTYKKRKTLQIMINDITDRKKTEEMLQNAEKLTVVGQLAAGIAHEIRNPLTAIKGFTQLLRNQINPNYAEVILQELDRIESIVSDLLILAKPQAMKMETCDLIDLINRTLILLNSQAIMNNVMIHLNSHYEELFIDCEPDQLKQVFINFIKNSIEAMPDGGTVVIDVQKYANVVQLEFVDEGMGIPQDRLAKIGQPFYSTKEKGTGLGMMICQRIIKNHKGTMTIRSEVDKGTTIQLKLPINLSK